MQTPLPDTMTRLSSSEAGRANAAVESLEEPVEITALQQPRPEPTRYGDWEKAGRCIDF
jgi:hypothetical protein